jgi:hypothetical protein
MRAISIAEYLDRSGRSSTGDHIAAPAADQETPPAGAKPEANSTAVSPLILMARKVTAPAALKGEPAHQLRPKSEPSAAREAAPVQDVEALIAEAYERGVRDGRSSAFFESSEVRAKDMAALTEATAAERLAFKREEYARLSAEISNGLAALEECISASVARILTPLIEAGRTEQIIRELRDAILRLGTA